VLVLGVLDEWQNLNRRAVDLRFEGVGRGLAYGGALEAVGMIQPGPVA
jgi:hypothetical protein